MRIAVVGLALVVTPAAVGQDAPQRPPAVPSRPLPELPLAGPTLVITAAYPGAEAAVVDRDVADPIDKQLDGLEGILHRVRACSDGRMRLTVTLKPGTDFNAAAHRVRERVSVAEPTLPEAAREGKIMLRKQGVPLLAVALTSPDGKYERTFVAAYAVLQLQDRFNTEVGVDDTVFYGDPTPVEQYRLWIDREKLAARNLTTADVTKALRDQNLTPSAPTKKDGGEILAVTGDRLSPESLEGLVVRVTKDAVKIRLRDVARIEKAAMNLTLTAVDGKPAAVLLVSRLYEAAPADVEKRIRHRVGELVKALPPGLELKVLGP